MGSRSAGLGGADAGGHSPWGLRRSTLWGHEACEGCARMGKRTWRRRNARRCLSERGSNTTGWL
eukprot:5555306-Pyramimonas_sp.AAC.1